MTGTVLALTYGSGLSSYSITQFLPSGPVQIWSAQNAGWFANGLTFPTELVASTGQQVFVAGSNSGTGIWRMDAVTKYDFLPNWTSQNLLLGKGKVEDLALGFSHLAIYTDQGLFICGSFTSIRVVDSTTCSTIADTDESYVKKIVWTLNPAEGGKEVLWISGTDTFVDPISLRRTKVNLTGCIFGCGMDLVRIDEPDVNFLPFISTLRVIDDRTLSR